MDFTLTQKEILEGALLGDGCLELPKNGKNAYFIYRSSCKEHVEFIHKYFKEYCTENNQIVNRAEIFDKRTNKTYVSYWFRTKCLSKFTEVYNTWYKPKKIVPNDISLSTSSVLIWYLGDGELESNYGYIKLHTNSFTKNECKFLSEKLGFESKISLKEKNQWLVTIPRKKVKDFLKFIGECPVECYQHKWQEVPYKNKNIEKNGIKSYKHLYESILKEWNKGNTTVYTLSKKYNIPHKCIYHFFEMNSIHRENINIKKKINQYNMEDVLIKTWDSGSQIKKELGFNASAISKCCRGVRKQYKQFKWKFYDRE